MEGNQLLHFDTKGTCFICLKPAVEVEAGSSSSSTNSGNSTASPSTYSLRNICQYLKLDMEMVHLMLNQGDNDEDNRAPTRLPDLKASLCQKCGTAVSRFSELLLKLDVVRMEMSHYMEVVGGLLSEGDEDAQLVGRFHQRMTSDINPKSFMCLRTVDELRKDMAQKSLESAKNYQARIEVERVTLDQFGIPNKTTASSHLGSTFQIESTPKVIAAVPAIWPLPPGPLPLPRSFICEHCEASFKFQESLEAHSEITHGMVLLKPESPQPSTLVAPPKPKKFKCGVCKKRFSSENWLMTHVRKSHPELDSKIPVGSTSASVYGRDLFQGQDGRNGSLSGTWDDDDSDLEEDGGDWTSQEEQLETDDAGFDQMAWMTPLYAANPNIQSSGAEVIPVGGPAVPEPRPMPPLIRVDQMHKLGDGQAPVLASSSGSTNAPQRGYRCSACPRVFAHRQSCNRHIRTAHAERMAIQRIPRQGQSPGIRSKCDLCDKTYAHQSSMLMHRQSIHFGTRYKCQHCSELFSYPYTMYHHRKHKCLMRPSIQDARM